MYSQIPEKIRYEFETTSKRNDKQHGFKYETTLVGGRKVAIYIAIPSHRTISSETYLKHILAWLHFVSEIASPKCAQTLNVYLLLTDAKKQLPEIDSEPIDTIHANTAFTTSCSSTNDIFVYRQEEWFKVLMHETFHCFGLDFSSSVSDGLDSKMDASLTRCVEEERIQGVLCEKPLRLSSNQRILSLFPTIDSKTDIRLYETFCEMWAEIFHLLFCLFSDDGVRKTGYRHFSESRFCKALRKEQIFSIKQSNRILQRVGYQYKDLFHAHSGPLANEPKYREKTQAFSYYVLKSLMLWNLNSFMKWCTEHSNNSPIQFEPIYIAKYCDFVEELTKHDGGYRQIVERMYDAPHCAPEISPSLRMTSIDPPWY